jgi:hypothetical protein
MVKQFQFEEEFADMVIQLNVSFLFFLNLRTEIRIPTGGGGLGIFVFDTASTPALVPTQPPIQ